MTNKQALPVIGKRYKSIVDDLIIKVIRIEGDTFYSRNEGDTKELHAPIRFIGYFEELPDQEPTIELEEKCWSDPDEIETAAEEWNAEPTTEESSTVDKVQEALGNLNVVLEYGAYKLKYPTEDRGYFKLVKAAQNLADALESSKPDTNDLTSIKSDNTGQESLTYPNTQETPVSSIVEHTSKSIWKPISELPEESVYVNEAIILVKLMSGEKLFIEWEKCGSSFKGKIDSFCRITDFITNQENLEKRIERLEQLNSKNE